MPEIAVFDTNVLFSATAWKGRPNECVELARAGTIAGVTCQELLDELAEKLISKLAFGELQAAETVIDLLSFLQVVPIAGQLRAIDSDPDDDKVLECAVNANATHIVTGDRRHLLPLGSFGKIQIVLPAEFLAIVSARLG